MNTQNKHHEMLNTSIDTSEIRELSQAELYQATGGGTSAREIKQFEAIVTRYGCTERRGGLNWAIPMYDRLRIGGKWPTAKALRGKAKELCKVDIATERPISK